MTDISDFIRTASAMVARNDRRAWRRALRGILLERLRVASVAWSAMALAAFLIAVLPMNLRQL